MKNGKIPKHEIVIFWDPADNIFVADVPELPGCMAHGSTREEALTEISVAIDLWLDVAWKHGKPVPEPRLHLLPA